MTTGIELMAKERQHQISPPGRMPGYEDQLRPGQLAAAASCYLELALAQVRGVEDLDEFKYDTLDFWPWDEDWFKTSPEPVQNLIKAGALIAAEIDRLQRQPAGSAAKINDGRPNPGIQTSAVTPVELKN